MIKHSGGGDLLGKPIARTGKPGLTVGPTGPNSILLMDSSLSLPRLYIASEGSTIESQKPYRSDSRHRLPPAISKSNSNPEVISLACTVLPYVIRNVIMHVLTFDGELWFPEMKVVAAYLLAVLGGNNNPSAKDLKAILGSGMGLLPLSRFRSASSLHPVFSCNCYPSTLFARGL